MTKNLALVALLGLAADNAAACFTVYDRTNAIVYYAQTPPVPVIRRDGQAKEAR